MAGEHVVKVHGTTVMVCPPEGGPLDADSAAVALIGEALGQRVEAVVIPAERLTDDFFSAEVGLGGELARKFDNYHLRLVVVGDTVGRCGTSDAPADVWFAPTFEDFAARLGG